jgi:hypothetical protein
MAETFDNDTGRPFEYGTLALGAGSVALVFRVIAENKEVIEKAGKALFEFAKANPKVTLGLAAVGGVSYCVYRLTRPGTTITFGKFKYERAPRP